MFEVTVQVNRVTAEDIAEVRAAVENLPVIQAAGFDDVVSLVVVDSERRAVDIGTHKAHEITETYEYVKSVKQVELIDNVYHVTFIMGGD